MKYQTIITALEDQLKIAESEKERAELMRTLMFYYRKRQRLNYSPVEITFQSAMNEPNKNDKL